MPTEPDSGAKANQRKDEKLFLVIVIALALLAGVGSWFAATALSRHDRPHDLFPDKERTLGEFILTNEFGQVVTRADLDKKILIVSFLFTSCSLTCPVVSKHMAEIQRLTANDADVRLVSFTVDPRSDTPPVLAKWGARFGADTNRWHFLTGNKTVLHGLIAKSFLAQDNSDPFNSMPGNFTGTERIAVVDRHGRTWMYFDGLREETPAAVVAELSQLRAEK
jgi:cytochrome oxidase Cu insertion factor (SCO1/SenC/PrrC family)